MPVRGRRFRFRGLAGDAGGCVLPPSRLPAGGTRHNAIRRDRIQVTKEDHDESDEAGWSVRTNQCRDRTGRRGFIKTGAAAAAGAAALGFPMVSRAQTTTLKMQGSWGAKSIFTEMAKQYVERVEKMSGGTPQDRLPPGRCGGQGVSRCRTPATRACSTAPIPWTAYWYGKNKAGLAVRHRARCSAPMPPRSSPGSTSGGGQGNVPGALAGHPEAQPRRVLHDADADPAARLVQEEDQLRRGPPGPEVPHRGPRHRHHAGHGASR